MVPPEGRPETAEVKGQLTTCNLGNAGEQQRSGCWQRKMSGSSEEGWKLEAFGNLTPRPLLKQPFRSMGHLGDSAGLEAG